MNFREYIRQGFVFLDGATGSNLQEHGMQAGDCPETWILEHPDVFVELQKGYIQAGSDVLYAPTVETSHRRERYDKTDLYRRGYDHDGGTALSDGELGV